jgi:hypothetical protein
MLLLVALLLRKPRRSRQTRYQSKQGHDFPLKHDEPLLQPAGLYMAPALASLIWIKLIAIDFPLNTNRPG